MTNETPTKLTRNQGIVHQALAAAERPLTAYEILDLATVRAEGLKAPLTIYRALDKLIALGLVHRIESLNAFMVCGHGHHHHQATGFIICQGCGKTVELPIDDCGGHLGANAARAGFAVDAVRVEMTGRCPDCT